MMLVIKRGYRNGRFEDTQTWRGCSLDNIIETLETIKKRMDKGIGHMGTEVKMIQVASWRNLIRSADDVQAMIEYYKAHKEVRA